MYLVGLDIGFGNLKLVKGYANQEAQEEIYPVGAAPLAHNASSLRGEAGEASWCRSEASSLFGSSGELAAGAA